MLAPTSHGLQRQIDSLLELSSRIADAEPMEILNTALLSVMGRIGAFKACIALPDEGTLSAPVHLCKGLPSVEVPLEVNHELNHELFRPGPNSSLAQAGVVLVAPLVSGRTVVGALCLGPSMHAHAYEDPAVVAYLEIARVIIGTTAHNALLVRSLKQSARQLEHRTLMITSLFETARDFATVRNHEDLFRLLSYRVMGQLMVSSVAIFLREPLNGTMVLEQRSMGPSLASLYNDLISIEKSLLVARLATDDPRLGLLQSASVAMVAPLTVHGVPKGVIVTGEPLSARTFTDEDLAYLEAIGSTAMMSIEQITKQRLDDELAIASEIQRGLLPSNPCFPGLEIAALHRPSGRVGGDYYDVIPLDAHRVMVAIADVAGKGIPAALLMANVQAALNVLATTDVSLSEMMHRINTVVCHNTEPEVFITMFVGVIDTLRGELTYVNAGHHPPLLVHDTHDVTLLREGGVLTGVLPDPPAYRTGVAAFGPGTLLLLYTDGVVEARTAGEEFGMDRLRDLTRELSSSPTPVVVESIARAAEAHHRDGAPDDVTIMAVRPS